jgi:hypothetical protein
MAHTWHVITGEYPPQPGGVADYTHVVACALTEAGDHVSVWAPACDGVTPNEPGVTVRRLGGRFGPSALAALDRALGRTPGRILLQYTPHAFGYKAMNVPLCAWLWARQRRLDVMFHEVAYPLEAGQPLKHRVLAIANRGMATLLLRAAERVFMSIPGWEPLLRTLVPGGPRPVWSPVPSNLPSECPPAAVAAIRQRLLTGSTRSLVGHFGTYGSLIAGMLDPTLVNLLSQRHDIHIVLLGWGGPAFADAFSRRNPRLAGQVSAPGMLDAERVAAHVQACDVMLQPYPDGISTRRSSAMGALKLGKPIVTTEGHLSETLWRETDAVVFAAPDRLAQAVIALLADAPRRAELGLTAAALYRARFAVEHTIRALRQVEAVSPRYAAV